MLCVYIAESATMNYKCRVKSDACAVIVCTYIYYMYICVGRRNRVAFSLSLSIHFREMDVESSRVHERCV